MTWLTRTWTCGPSPTERLELAAGDGHDELALVGPSLWGWIYRSTRRPACYRLLPMSEAPLELRAEVQAWRDRPRRPALAPIVEAAQDLDHGVFFMRYEIAAEQSLHLALREADRAARLRWLARTVAAMAGWWRSLGGGFLPLPADVVFGAGLTPYLLAMPRWRPPPIEAVLAAPERALYLAPEAVRGRAGGEPEALDRYALGAALLHAFFYVRPGRADEVLARAAGGATFRESELESGLPRWTERVPATAAARAAAWRLVDPDPRVRAALDLGDLAASLAACGRSLDPASAVRDAETEHGAGPAFELLQEILLEEETDELVALAGRLALAAGRPLEAIDFCERALARDPAPELFEQQLQAIAALVDGGPVSVSPRPDVEAPGAFAKLDAILWRDFQHLGGAAQGRHETVLARYLLRREDFQAAASFIHPRLFEGEKYLWWKFSLTLGYVEALIGLENHEEARRMLADVKRKLAFVRENRTVPSDEIQRHGRRVGQLEARLLAPRQIKR